MSLFSMRSTLVLGLLSLFFLSCRKDKTECDSFVDPTLEFRNVRYDYNSDGSINSVSTIDESPKSSIRYSYENGKITKIDLQLDGGAYFSESNFFWEGNHALLKFQQEAFWTDTVFIDIDLNAQGYVEKYDAMSFYYDSNMVLDSIVDLRTGYNYFYQFNYENDQLSEVLMLDYSDRTPIFSYHYLYSEEGLLFNYRFFVHSSGNTREYTYSYNRLGALSHVSIAGDSQYSAIQTGCGVLINMDPINFWRFYHLRLPVIGQRWH